MREPAFAWYRKLTNETRRAFWATIAGWGLDAFDYMIFTLVLSTIISTWHISKGQAGLLATVTLLVSALGGLLAGTVADTIGRVPTLMLSVGTYSLFTFLSGLAQNYGQLLTFRALEGLGFGGEWAVGAVLISELATAEARGTILGYVQSGWAVGWGAAVIAYTITFSLLPAEVAWRVLFLLGILPALLIVYVRRYVKEPEVYVKTREAKRRRSKAAVESGALANPLVQIFRKDLLARTVLAALLAIGAQGGYYAIFTWLPTYLKTVQKLSVVGTGSYLFMVVVGSYVGYLTSGYLNDRIGRRGNFMLYAIVSALLAVAVSHMALSNVLLVLLAFPLGFFASGIFSGFGSFLAELFPSRARGAGQGFTYNVGRAVGALFPALIGALASKYGLAGAISIFGPLAYLLCLVAVLFLPETRGRMLTAVA